MFTASQLLDKINNYISEIQFTREPKGLYEPIEYILSLGGKRIRPVLMLMAYNLYREDVASIYDPAAAIEVYHNHTLLHDDLMDRSDMRRGKPTVHKVWNDNTAILSGDAMLILAFRLMTAAPSEHLKEVMELFGLTTLEICEGQQLDMEFESRDNVTEDEYIEMIRLKTAVLLAGSLKIGAILAGATAEDAENLYNFGMQIGVAFQLQDDLLDVYGDPEVFGKKIGGDILCNKKTYMLIKALNRADEKQREELDRWLNADDCQPAEKIEAVTGLYNQLDIRNVCENKMREYYTSAMESLAAVAVAEERKKELKNLVKLLMYREMFLNNMPYRRLPNTDQARVRALKAAVEKGDLYSVRDLAISLKTLFEARNFLQRFEAAQIYYTQCYDNQAKASRKHQANVKTARLYISHFIQVLNLAVLRDEIKTSHKNMYGLPEANVVPDLLSEAALVEWGKKIIEGEQQRTAQGGIPIYNPTIARVKVHYDIFLDSYERQKNLQALTNRSLEELASMRGRADELILDIWNQVETKYQDVTPNEVRLDKCRDYGLIYYYRSSEKVKEENELTC